MRVQKSNVSVQIISQIFFVGIIIIATATLFSVRSQSQEVILQTAAVQNVAPQIESIITSTSPLGPKKDLVSLIEGTTRTLFIWGSVVDQNGCLDMVSVPRGTVVLYKSNILGALNCTVHNNNCYKESNLSFTGCSGINDTTAQYSFSVPLHYYADATDTGSADASTDWTAYVTIFDGSSAYGAGNDRFELESLVALTTQPNFDFGSLSLGEVSSIISLPVINTGNTKIDIDVKPNDHFLCSGKNSATLLASNIHISALSPFNYDTDGIALDKYNQKRISFDLPRQNSTSTPSQKNMYVKLKIPNNLDIYGTCQVSINFTAVPR